MDDIKELLNGKKDNKIALYGLGTETERFLSEYGDSLCIVGLLDGFREDGEIYGYPIIPISEAVESGVSLIIVVARPGSCKAIAKRIGALCIEKNIALFDVRGKDLLAVNDVSYVFSGLEGYTVQCLLEKIEKSDVISFDFFETLIARIEMCYTDLFELIDLKLKEKGIIIPDFARLRLYAEKELSKSHAPRLEEIYAFLLEAADVHSVSAGELADFEWMLDQKTIIERKDVCGICRSAISAGKTVCITSDTYYSREQIESIIGRFGLSDVSEVFASCEYGVSKTQGLYSFLKERYPGKKILHIGDDETTDIEKASEYGIDTQRIYNGADLYDHLGGFGLDNEIKSYSDRVKVGMLIASVFNSPFWFEEASQKVSVKDSFGIGYSFCAPMITDFVLWMKRRAEKQGYKQLLFCARDGYLPIKLYEKVATSAKSFYFLSSRTAAIRAGMEKPEDIEYVDSMKYSGSADEALKRRFGIDAANVSCAEREEEILRKSKIQRENYKKYIDKLNMDEGSIGMFDFVAKGTTQMYLQKLFDQHIKGFYFLQLEPEFMADKGLDIEPFYSDEEKNRSAIFDNYYILETILTAPFPQLEEFDESGEPVFAKETRNKTDIEVFEKAQKGIIEYFEKYIELVPEAARIENKRLDEKILSLVNKIRIMDEDFLKLKVEDPFFGRMTDIRDVIG
ncbi:hypothetical protein [Butyrivibrio sp. AE2005]|uniref:hypothetical protein n=1 Tax=Butyrivibrio sp. AE2005 TaxID=1496722 RepID=UPI000479F422|nr:hypothetical protein [Butyrivibrio sp. AE2005]